MAAEDNSLATAQASVAGTVEDDTDQAPASTASQGAKTLVPVDPVDVDADDLALMDDSVNNPSSSSSSSSSSSLKDHPNSASIALPEDMEMDPLTKNPIPLQQVLQCQVLLLHHCSLLETINRPLGMGPP